MKAVLFRGMEKPEVREPTSVVLCTESGEPFLVAYQRGEKVMVIDADEDKFGEQLKQLGFLAVPEVESRKV